MMMSKYISRGRTLRLGAAALAAMALAACVEKKSDTLAQDSTLNKDIQLANRDSMAQPQLRDTAATATPAPAPAAAAPAPAPTRTTTPRRTTTTTRTPAPVATTPRPTTTASGNTVTRGAGAATSGGAVGTIASGSTLNLASNSRVCTNTNKVGDRVTATLKQAVTGSNGAVIPAGATANLEITQLKRSENVNDKIQMGFRITSVSFGGHTYPVAGTIASAQVDRVKNQPSSKDAQKVATGAAVGAVVGQIIGHNTKSTVIGGAVGAAAGAGAAAATSNYEGCVPDGGSIVVTLNSPLQVHTS
jgi:hypothetical protein